LRNLAPAETLVYLETRDLQKTLDALTENKTFLELSKTRPDFSAFGNIQVGIAVTGFETSEKRLTDENSILNFKPHFVAIADTHAWKPTAVSIAENQIGKFVKEIYGDDVKMEKAEKRDAKFFTWTSADGRKLFSAVSHSIIYVANDETLLDKCLAVERGEAESLFKNESLSRAYTVNSANNLAFGYVSSEGVAQISNLAGVSVASEASEEAEGQSFIARVLPQILRNTTREIVWTTQKSQKGIEDKLSVSLNTESISVIKETLATAQANQTSSAEFLPANLFGATRYNLKNPLIGWRSLLLLAAKNTDAISGKMIVQFSASLLEPYGIADVEAFLNEVDSTILTAKFDAEGEKSIAVVTVKDKEKIKQSLTKEINFKVPPENRFNAEIWQTENKVLSAAFVENKLILGDPESVLQSLQAKQNGQNFTKTPDFLKFNESRAVAVTFSEDMDSADKIVSVLSEAKDENKRATTSYVTETQITEKGFERKSVSEFGLIGTILEQIEE